MVDAIFRRSGDTYLPTEHATGPWDPRALHGGPPCALLAGRLAQAIHDADLGVEFLPARFTAALLRPVPSEPLHVEAVVRRPGRRICLAEGTVAGPDGKPAITATLQGIRRRPFDHDAPPADAVPPPPSTGSPLAPETLDGPPAFHRTGVQHRNVVGRFETPGPATDWIRLAFPLVEGEETTPLERVVAAADFGNGVSRLFDMEEVLFVNPDLSVMLHRLPVGEWVCLDAVTRLGPDGVAVAESLLFDQTGPIGRAVQTLLVEPR